MRGRKDEEMSAIEFKLPDIGEGVAEGEITSWKVSVGDELTEDQVMVEVMTDKATVEIGSPVDGRVAEIRAGEGDVVPVGSVIIVLEDGGGGASAAPASTAKAASSGGAASGSSAGTAVASKAAAPSGGGDGLEEIDFALPDIGEGVAEGEITKWIVAEGDSVHEDQPMLEVMTDKATVEIGSPVDGKVLKLLHDEGATVPVGEILLVLGSSSGAPKMHSDHGAQAAPKKEDRVEADVEVKPSTNGSTNGTSAPAAPLAATGLPARSDGTRRVRAAPAVRRLARELDVDISRLNGTGPNSRVTMDDVRRAEGGAPVPAAAPARSAPSAAPAAGVAIGGITAPAPHDLPGDRREPLRGLRRRIATQMRTAKQVAAHFSYIEEIDVTELVAMRKSAKPAAAAKGVKLTYMPFIVKAVTQALPEFPLLNASLDEAAQEVVYHSQLNIGFAVDTPNGLIVPVLKDAGSKSGLQIAREIAEKAERARDGKTQPDDLGGGTFTITNAGNIGGLLATPVINVPEVAIMGVHAIRRKPWIVNDEIVPRDIMYLSLSLDHRVVDGAVGAYFMNRIKELLENPALMVLGEA